MKAIDVSSLPYSSIYLFFLWILHLDARASLCRMIYEHSLILEVYFLVHLIKEESFFVLKFNISFRQLTIRFTTEVVSLNSEFNRLII